MSFSFRAVWNGGVVLPRSIQNCIESSQLTITTLPLSQPIQLYEPCRWSYASRKILTDSCAASAVHRFDKIAQGPNFRTRSTNNIPKNKQQPQEQQQHHHIDIQSHAKKRTQKTRKWNTHYSKFTAPKSCHQHFFLFHFFVRIKDQLIENPRCRE